jgi:ribosomal protein L40E
MDTDLGNLTMVSKQKANEETCPKCHAAYRPGAKECPQCGVIFTKLKSPTPETPADAPAAPADARTKLTPPPAHSNPMAREPLDKRKKLIGILIFLCVFGGGFYCLYVNFLESRVQAGGFQEEQIIDFCFKEIPDIHPNSVAEGDDPFRTGKVLVVSERQEVTLTSVASGKPHTMVLEEGIHPAWHKLPGKIRAGDPSAVDTLIRVHKVIGRSGRYGDMKTKVYNTHKIVLDVYDWKNKTYIGTKIFDPGEGSAFMTEEDFDDMMASVSDMAIAEYIRSMEIHE